MSFVLAAPALPLRSAGKYVAGAYVVFLAVILIYVAIMAVRQKRGERELAELAKEVLERQTADEGPVMSDPLASKRAIDSRGPAREAEEIEEVS